MSLQWFAAEDEGRTFDPTDTTYRKAREEGRVSKSQDLTASLGLLLPGIALVFLAPWMLRNSVELVRFFFTRLSELDPLADRVSAGVAMRYFARLTAPLLAVGVVAGLFSNIAQVGFLFATKPLVPDFTKVLPRFDKYFKKIFSLEGVVNFLKSIFKMGLIGTVAFFLIRGEFERLVSLQTVELWNGITLISSIAARLLIIVGVILFFLSIPDIYFQKHQFKESLKMSRDSFKEEMKQEEGNPQMRQRLKSRYRELLSQKNIMSEVPKADVVITNPTHYSVALLYDPNGPKVIAKGEDDVAFRIREIAEQNGVPVVSHAPLTRALYHETELGDHIPSRYWNVVIVLLGKFFTFEQKQERARRRAEV
ncbi:MAG: EscU/YscU/HrcU family type III secretion system export apparatus switch protein [Treponema sp.]|nr:EscU/YscU/HrcU family type III secretion system export apparatus switch protein [Treponema sp.]